MKLFSKLIVFITVLFLFPKLLPAQIFKLTGRITDSSGQAIANASISIINKTSLNVVAYTISNKTGNFSIIIDSVDKRRISISCIGYKKIEENISTAAHKDTYILEKILTLLPNVTIINKPISIQGDTINYTTSFFTNSQDRVIGDVIANLPGIEIDANGSITYNGNPISHYYIDGLDLLGTKYNIANNNIPADIVEKIQLLNRHQPIKALDSFAKGNEIAINLKLKAKAKNRLISKAKLGLGIAPLLWDNEVTTMNFRKNLQLIGAYKNNNAGNYLYTEVDEVAAAVPLGEQINEAADSKLLNLVNLPDINLTTKRYRFNNSHLLHFNILYQLKNKAQLKLNTSEYIDKTQKEGKNETYIYLPADTISFNETYKTVVSEKKFKTELNYTINKEKYYLNNKLVYKNNYIFEDGSVHTSQNNLQSLVSNLNDLNNDFIVTKVKNKNVISISSKLIYSSAPQELDVQPGSFADVFNGGMGFQLLTQKTRLKNFLTNTAIKFIRKKKNFQYESKLGIKTAGIHLQSFFTEPSNSSGQLTADSLNNNIAWSTLNPYLQTAFSIEKNRKKIELSLPTEINITIKKNLLTAGKTSYTNTFFNPRININIPVSPLFEIQAGFTKQTDIKSVSEIYSGYILNNYRTLKQNNSILPIEKLYNFKGSVAYQNPAKGVFFYFTTSYTILQKNLLINTLYNGSLTKSSAIEKWNTQYNLVFTSYINKYLLSAKTSISVIYVGSKIRSELLLQNEETQVTLFSQNLKLKAAINRFSWFTFENTLSLNKTKSNLFQTQQNTPVVKNFNVQNNSRFYFFLTKKISTSLNTDYFYFSDNQNKHSSYLFFDAGIRYKYNRWDTEISITNITNNKMYSTALLKKNINQMYSYTIRPANVLLKLYFSF